jgi:thioredoxin reductase
MHPSTAVRCRTTPTKTTTALQYGRNPGVVRACSVNSPDFVVERRAADVAVIGDDTHAVLAAYALAKTGRKVHLCSQK